MSELIYDPNNPLSDEELDKIAEEDFDKFLEYLDSKTDKSHPKKFLRPGAQGKLNRNLVIFEYMFFIFLSLAKELE